MRSDSMLYVHRSGTVCAEISYKESMTNQRCLLTGDRCLFHSTPTQARAWRNQFIGLMGAILAASALLIGLFK